MWVTAGTSVQIPIQFMVEDDFVLPSTARADIRDVQGVVTHSTPLDLSTTSAILEIPETALPLGGGDFTTFFITVQFTALGGVYQQRHTLYVTPFIPLTVGATEVRALLGIPSTELQDQDIEVFPAYFRLLQQEENLLEYLQEGGSTSLEANRAVALEAAISLVPSLQLRIGQKLKSEDQEFARFTNVDWAALVGALKLELDGILSTLSATDDTAAVTNFAWAIPTDAITGE